MGGKEASVGLFGQSHAAMLRQAQDLWDDDRRDEAVALLESVLPSHVEAHAWMDAGWKTESVSLLERCVTFVRE